MILSLLFSMNAHSAEPLGRLFFTSAERQVLEQQRQNKTAAIIQSGGNATVNGVIQKHGSDKTLVWINSNSQIQDSPEKSSNKSSVPITVPSTGQSIDVKVGQTLDMDSGNVAETYVAKSKIRQGNKPPSTPTEERIQPNNGR